MLYILFLFIDRKSIVYKIYVYIYKYIHEILRKIYRHAHLQLSMYLYLYVLGWHKCFKETSNFYLQYN